MHLLLYIGHFYFLNLILFLEESTIQLILALLESTNEVLDKSASTV